ncbi:hypothetical protein SAMN02745775_101659 [Falsiroseomonas stagni DSM 19981]|jgi:hypothetical protein|uniref:Uncharacterized protein n=1 Tax=Falsiroseomonas stagni DSM 19981 TaxID=1123062 RepID=A0A1I3XU92_9PROT|nr:hypothetical protein SAMN02745775_101659 [Falsiroseomonas stagni DSM 19981]
MCWFCMGPDAQLGFHAEIVEEDEEEAPVQETGAPTASSPARATSMSSE